MPTRAEKVLAKGQGLEKKGKRDKALEAYREGCKSEPYDPDLWIARGSTALALGLKDEATDSLFHVADLFARSGMLQQSLDSVQRVLKIDAGHAAGKRLLRVVEQRLGIGEPEPAKAAAAVPAAAPVPAPTPAVAAAPPPPAPVAPEPESVDEEVDPVELEAVPVPIPVPTAKRPATPPPSPPAVVFAAAPPKPAADRAVTLQTPPPPPAVAVKAAPVREPTPPPVPTDARGKRPPPRATKPMEPVRAASEASRRRATTTTTSSPAASAPSEEAAGGVVAELATGVADAALDALSLADHLPGKTGVDLGENATEYTLDDDIKLDVVQMVASTLTTSPLLAELDSDLVRHLIDCGKLVRRAPGEVVFREGDQGSSLFLILSGEVSVVREAHRNHPERELAHLRAGAFFGEMALLTSTPRSATVVATKSSDFLEISRKSVRELIERDPKVLKLLMRFFRARLVGTLLQTSPLFKPFSREERRALVPRFRLRELGADSVVLREGVDTEGLFIVLVGKLEVVQAMKPKAKDTSTATSVLLGSLAPGDVFGEMSILDQTPAIATVRTRTRSWVLLLPRDDYGQLAAQHPQMSAYLGGLANERKEQNRAAVSSSPNVASFARFEPI